MKRIFWLMLMLVFVGCGGASNQSADNGDVTTANTSAEQDVGIVFDYLKVFPYTIGTYEAEPVNVIAQLNKQEKFGYNTWRIPTQEELSLLAANGYAIDDNYMCSERPRGVVLLVTDDADASAVNDRRQQESAAAAAAAEKARIEKSIADDGLGRDGVYEVGYYYNRDGKQGVVFEVKNGGRNGKIISLDETYDSWYGAKSWCRDKGDGWYLPSKDELLAVCSNKSLVNKTLVDKGEKLYGWYWTSEPFDGDRAWFVLMNDGKTYSFSKYLSRYVRAVSAF